jgi:hypothetical protein
MWPVLVECAAPGDDRWGAVDLLGRLRWGLRWLGAALVVVGVLGLVFGWGSTTTTRRSGATAGTGTTASPAETPESFLAAFVSALKAGDRTFLLGRLDPAVIDRYGTAQCQTYLAGFADPNATLRLVGVTGPAPFDYASDGLTRRVAGTYTLSVDGTLQGGTGPRQLHFALVDGHFRFFVDCGTPVAGGS